MTTADREDVMSGRQQGTRGFTLLELMFGMTIISILLVIALPIYQGYRIRAKISEGKGLMPPIRTSVTDAYYSKGTFPANNAEAGMSAAGDYRSRYIDSIELAPLAGDGGVEITITYNSTAIGGIDGDNTLVYRGVKAADGSIAWDCLGGTLADIYRGNECRE